jgi:SsrA-binding protein
MATKTQSRRPVAQNRKAFHNYTIEERHEAGLVLQGTEVKSLREGRASLNDAYAGEIDGELWLLNVHIPEYRAGNRFNHEPKRPRKLLLHRREMAKLLGEIRKGGYTVVPLQIYFNSRGIAKAELGLARGKKAFDKRAAIKDRDWQRQKERLFRRDKGEAG